MAYRQANVVRSLNPDCVRQADTHFRKGKVETAERLLVKAGLSQYDAELVCEWADELDVTLRSSLDAWAKS